jgi:hypothetical protein
MHAVGAEFKMQWRLWLASGIFPAVLLATGCGRRPAPSLKPAPPQNAPVISQEPVPPKGPIEAARPVDPYTLEYNPATEITVRGNILGIRRIPLSDDRTGLMIRVHAGGGLPWVYLGPEPWVSEHCGSLAMTQTVGVTGSIIEENSQPLLVARTIETAEGRVQLRDDLGTPHWTLPFAVSASTEQTAEERRQRYLKQMLDYHERQAEAIRAKLLVKPLR